MNAIELFKNPEFGEVRVVEVNNEPYFVGKDIAEVLGYENPSKAINDHCDEDNYKVLTYKALNETLLASLWNGNDYSNKVIINEFGVYELILGSELPSAKALEYANPSKAVIDHCKGVTILENPTNGGIQKMKYGILTN